MSALFAREAASNASQGPPPDAGRPAGPSMMTPEQFAALPHDSLGPKLNAVTWALACISGLFLALRIYCKTVLARGLWWDDWMLIASWVAVLGMSIVTSITVGLGYGKHSWDVPFESLPQMFKIYSIAGTFSICASAWSKTSFALTILRLTDGWMKKVIWFLIISMNIFMAVTALINYIHCWPLDKLWDFTGALPGTCWPIDVVINYDIFSATYSGVVDLALALLPWQVIMNLQMRRKEKIGVAIAMSMGIFASATAFVKASYLNRMTSFDIYDSVDLSFWSTAESTVSIMAASIPILRVLLQDVKKTMFTRQYYYGSGNDGSASARMPTQDNHKVMVTARTTNRRNSGGTEGSEMDILKGGGATTEEAAKGGVVVSSAYAVKYEEGDEWKGGRRGEAV